MNYCSDISNKQYMHQLVNYKKQYYELNTLL